jgi:hypothetical protein
VGDFEDRARVVRIFTVDTCTPMGLAAWAVLA